MSALLPLRIEGRIQTIRGLRLMIDSDLAELYGVPTKRLNEQVKLNRARFPADFMFQLTTDEKAEVVANCDHLSKLKFSKSLPYAFTEHGAFQAANVLASTQAIEIENDAFAHNTRNQLRQIFDALRELNQPPDPPKRPIGFVPPQDRP